jgi:hypothetical protein
MPQWTPIRSTAAMTTPEDSIVTGNNSKLPPLLMRSSGNVSVAAREKYLQHHVRDLIAKERDVKHHPIFELDVKACGYVQGINSLD